MSINQSIFRSYDIRGVFPEDINEDIGRQIGQAFAGMVLDKNVGRKVLVGRDMRLASPDLAQGLIQGLVESGLEVDDIGLCGVDMVYFAVGRYGYAGGVMVTASHNPKEYGGYKMVLKNMEWVRGVELKEVLDSLKFEKVKNPGVINTRDIWQDYIDHVLFFIDKDKLKPLKIVVDAGNGMAGLMIPKLMKDLPVEIIPIDFELDGNFPGRESNPLAPGASDQVADAIRSEKADFGVLFDGDTDRLMFVDETGKLIQADIGLIVLAKYFLDKYPGKAIAHNVICTKAVSEFVRKFGGRPIRTKVGFINVSQGLKENDGVIGGEVSAHYSFADNYYADSGMIAFVIMLQIASQSDQKLSEIAAEYEIYHRGEEVNLQVENIQEVLDKIKDRYKAAKIDELDGVTVDYGEWWFNVRPSNTEPLLRITLEAKSKDEMEQKRDELLEFIKSVAN